MPDDTMQLTASVAEPAQSQVTVPRPTVESQQPVSEPIIDPVATQSPTEPAHTGTPDSGSITMPSGALEGPTSPSTPDLGQISVSSLPTPIGLGQTEPQNQSQALVTQPVEPTPVAQPVTVTAQPNPRSFLSKALASIQFRKKAKFEKIMRLVSTQHSITNDQVQKLLYVSDATASHYLLQLVKERRLKKVGPDGRARCESRLNNLDY
ncbi:hypothetical protein COU14_03335 [Candidatus Kaiserbacteria bacterium CG10_big_fil_rev_8_21_14_0_10_44_10]|uniref:Uncharacterized protein n=1 Tax=Candidatus Kaiserbacteria bacterium CG10_big_fil_rev_8_21_14_0_10_44_10 TaxID=1974606 RepID=A0A2H0UGV5_9BACT|nr:MAG: hypothetical protein COU14_03335 [Candidatus Kaiserbacteria bacterium CG10_big_fil_rev_8_21_14_0_10_44_10]